MEIGITSSAYLKRYGIKDGAKRMKIHGYTAVDFQDFINTESEFFKLDENSFENSLKEQRKIIEGEGLFFSQAHSPWRFPPQDSTPSDRQERLSAMKKAIKGTSVIGAKNFVVHPIMPFGLDCRDKASQMKELNGEFLYKLCLFAEDFNVDVCLENMPFLNMPISSIESIINLVNELGFKNLKVCLDTGHDLIWGNQPSESVDKIGQKLACIHAHDNDGLNDYHKLPKTGVCNWEDFVKSLKKSTYTGVFSLETKVESGLEGEEIKLITTVKNFLK